MRRAISTLLAVVAGGLLALGGAYLGNRVRSSSEEQASPRITNPVWIGSGSSSSPGAPAAGTTAALDDPSPVTGLPDAGWMLPADYVATAGTETPGGSDTTSTTAVGGVSATAQVPVADVAATAGRLGTAQLDSARPARRFVDQCAAGGTPCPFGIGADIVPFALPGDPQAPLNLRIWPGLTQALDSSLRCDPGYRSSRLLPVVVTADQPLYRISVTLSIVGGPGLDEYRQTGTPQSEQAWYDQRVNAGQAVGTNVDNGLQYCASLRTEADPLVNQTKVIGTSFPTPLVYLVHVDAEVFNGPQASLDMQVPQEVVGTRPPVTLSPLSGNVVQITVPELDPSNSAPPQVWAQSIPEFWDDPTTACVVRPQPAYTDRETQLGVLGPAQPYDAAQLARTDYPYDRAYSHFAVTNLVLPEAQNYLVCVLWTNLGAREYQGFSVQTPDGLTFTLEIDSFTSDHGKLHGFVLTAPDAGCSSSVLDPHSGGPKFDEMICNSDGLAWPNFTTFISKARRTDGTEVDMGTRTIATLTWCSPTPGQISTGMGIAIVTYFAAFGCHDQQWDVTFTWADNVLCNDTMGGGCDQYVHATAHATARLVEGASNGRRGQLDWWFRQSPSIRVNPVAQAPPAP